MATITVIKGKEHKDTREMFMFQLSDGRKASTKAFSEEKAAELIRISFPDEISFEKVA